MRRSPNVVLLISAQVVCAGIAMAQSGIPLKILAKTDSAMRGAVARTVEAPASDSDHGRAHSARDLARLADGRIDDSHLDNALTDAWPAAATPKMLLLPCMADLNGDSLLSNADVLAFLDAFSSGGPTSDFDGDGFLSFEDFDAFVHAFEAGCRTAFEGPLFPGPVYPAGSTPFAVAVGDLDGDGHPDLAFATYGPPGFKAISVARNRGNGTFESELYFDTGEHPWSIAIGDVDGDGRPDLAVANNAGASVSVLRNITSQVGAIAFAPKVDYGVGQGPRAVAIEDLDGDGRADLAVANFASNTLSVLRNLGNGVFATKVDHGTGGNPCSVAIRDIDGDTHLDLVVANYGSPSPGSTVSVLRNLGNGTFAAKVDYPTGPNPNAVAVGDLNSDGWPDLAVTNSNISLGGDTISVLTNRGDGTFAAKVDYAGGSGPAGVAIGDIDGDSRPDLVVANSGQVGYGEAVSVLRNLGGATFTTRTEYPAGAGPSSVAMADLDGDGDLDLAVANSGNNSRGNSVSILENLGDGTLNVRVDYATGGYPTSVAVGDLDDDGHIDLAVVNSNQTIRILRNVGDGSFVADGDFATGANPRCVAIGDLDGDGKPDLAVANYDADTISVLRNLRDHSFAPHVDYTAGSVPTAIAIGDLNGDGNTDLAVVNQFGNSISVLRNLGNGTVATKVDYASGDRPVSIVIGDLNGDGKPELAVANSGNNARGNSVSVLRNLGNGTFATKVDYATAQRPVSIAIGDLNGDDRPDLATANNGFSGSGRSVSVLLNAGNGTFAPKVEALTADGPYAIAIGDLDGDGRLDVATANAGSNSVSVLRNVGKGQFTPSRNYSTGATPSWIALADLDGDCFLDIAVSNGGYYPAFRGALSVLRNQSRRLRP